MAAFVLAALLPVVGAAAAQAIAVEDLLQQLRQSGVDVIYSTELVTHDWLASPDKAGATSLEFVREVLAERGLELRLLGRNRYVVVRAQSAPGPRPAPDVQTGELGEVSVYASRYAIGDPLSSPLSLSSADLDLVPGTRDDAVRAIRTLPGMATNASGRPYIRGSLSGDILIRYDGITLLDPYHLKNFQSLISAIDPAVVKGIEVFSGGFPVQYGTRSGGVINISAPAAGERYEVTASASLLAAGLSTSGKSRKLPLEWLAAVRRSTLDLIEPVESGVGSPRFGDSMGRLRWTTERGAWTVGWLLIDDQLKLSGGSRAEDARARYRDQYVWLVRDHGFGNSLSMRTSLVVTDADHSREGTLDRPGIASGTLQDAREFGSLELSSDWTFRRGDKAMYILGATLGSAHADYSYSRTTQFPQQIAIAFGRTSDESYLHVVKPGAVTFGLYGAWRYRLDNLEMESGARLDMQHYRGFETHAQLSPRLNVRYDFRSGRRLYASVGRFTQAQPVQEWRMEEAQVRPDPAQISIHAILGLGYDLSAGGEIGLEVYQKRWTTVSPYFDSMLDPLTLLPDLSPDRLRITPEHSEASGMELRGSLPVSEQVTANGSLAWALVSDDSGVGSDVPRSWDQPVSVTGGLSWAAGSTRLSLLAGWHSGWPRTAYSDGPLVLGPRNGARWSDFYTLDLRASRSWQLAGGDLTVVLDATNATNRVNPCCTVLRQVSAGYGAKIGHWLPAIVNLGFSYRLSWSP